MRLSQVQIGSQVVVASVHDGDRARRLEDLGFLPGTVVRVERQAPLGDPVVYELRGVRLAMRRGDAALIEVDEVPGDAPR
jgi:ferrous iron transport protein A